MWGKNTAIAETPEDTFSFKKPDIFDKNSIPIKITPPAEIKLLRDAKKLERETFNPEKEKLEIEELVAAYCKKAVCELDAKIRNSIVEKGRDFAYVLYAWEYDRKKTIALRDAAYHLKEFCERHYKTEIEWLPDKWKLPIEDNSTIHRGVSIKVFLT